ncbi:MAG TPA: RIP metalloprotease RseP [Gemmatimonadales bacterium]|nr:RIP metalloprotease RseP [Gemmatimonadales bacterium]
MNFLFTVGVLIIVLGVLIFVHELGHFLAAKWAGIRVHRFALGMGNPVPGLSFRRGDTEYAICWLPLGGYVKMATAEEEVTSSALEGGQVEEPVPPEEMFEAKPVWKRTIVILAGVTMNVLFAYLVFTWLAAKNGEQLEPTTTVGIVSDSLPAGAEALRELKPGDRIVRVGPDSVTSWNDVEAGIASTSGERVDIGLADGRVVTLKIHQAALAERIRASQAVQPFRPAILGTIVSGRPADRAGLKVMDSVISINGEPMPQWYDLVTRVRSSAGQPLTFKVLREGREVEVTVMPELETETVARGVTEKVGKIGAGPYIAVTTRPYGIGAAFGAGARATLTASTQIVRTVQGLLSARISSREVGGPILIGQMAAQSARLGLDAFLSFMALVSVNLAVLNLLPIPVLDGGQFLFLMAEGVLRRPLSLRLRERLTLVGLFLIVCLMVLAFSNDIRRLLGV